MKILLTFDTGYAPHAASVMESIIQNCPEKLDFAVVYYDLTVDVQNIMSNHFAEKVKSLEFFKVEENIVMGYKSDKSLSWVGISGILRLFAPKFLINDRYVIYLDCDIIVQDNILNILKDANLSKPICAVTEYDPAYKYKYLAGLQPIEIPAYDPFIYEAYWFRAYNNIKININAKYFNAGVMIINLDYWREHNIMERALTFLRENPDKAFAQDQDALNHVINGDFYPFHPKWNNSVVCTGVLTNYSAKELTAANSLPSIIHFAGSAKPWQYKGGIKYQKYYFKYRKLTPWPKVEYENISIKLIFIKHVRHPVVKIIKNIRLYIIISFLKLNVFSNSILAKMRL